MTQRACHFRFPARNAKFHKDDIKQMAIDRGYEELAKKPALNGEVLEKSAKLIISK